MPLLLIESVRLRPTRTGCESHTRLPCPEKTMSPNRSAQACGRAPGQPFDGLRTGFDKLVERAFVALRQA